MFPLALGSVWSPKHHQGGGGTQQDLADPLGAEGKVTNDSKLATS